MESKALEIKALTAGEDTVNQTSTGVGCGRLRIRLLGIALLGLLVMAACGRNKTPGNDAPKPLETVEVDEGPEAGFTTANDEFAAPRPTQEMAGILPSDFPADVPVFSPSSLVDFGSPGSERFVEIDTSAPITRVRASLESQLSSAGWSGSGSSDEAMVFVKAGRQLKVILKDLSAGTRIRYVY